MTGLNHAATPFDFMVSVPLQRAEGGGGGGRWPAGHPLDSSCWHSFNFTSFVTLWIFHSASRVVAVVGAGHLPGIRANWESDIDVVAISEMPPPRRSARPYLLAASGLALSAVVLIKWRQHSHNA